MLPSAARSRRLAALIALLAALTGCVSTKPISPAEHLWTAKGKLGVRQQQNAKSLNFIWSNHSSGFDIRLYGNLGLGNIKINRQGNEVSLTTNKGTTRADTAEALLYQVTGWDFPISALAHWIRGETFPKSDIDAITQDNDERILALQQEGWQIEYQRYHPQVNAASLPKKIVATREDLTLTFVIKSWQ